MTNLFSLFMVLLAVLAAAAVVDGQDSSANQGVDSESAGLASVPDMYGDFFVANQLSFDSDGLSAVGFVNSPQRGRVKIGENNSILPSNRAYFLFQHYNNAIEALIRPVPVGVATTRSLSVSRYTLGVEKTSPNGIWSAEIRLPMWGDADRMFDPDVFVSNGNVDNLSLIIKCLLWASETTAVSAGLGLSVPTGNETAIKLGQETFRIENESVHLQPFFGVARAWDRAFFQGFAQLDIPISSNSVTAQRTGSFVEDFGSYKDQTLLFLDASAGYWLLRRPDAPLLTGLAAIAELHYTTALGGAGTASGLTVNTTAFAFEPAKGAVNALTITSALHCNLTQRTALRAAAVAPLTDSRSFDSEIWVSLNCRF